MLTQPYIVGINLTWLGIQFFPYLVRLDLLNFVEDFYVCVHERFWYVVILVH